MDGQVVSIESDLDWHPDSLYWRGIVMNKDDSVSVGWVLSIGAACCVVMDPQSQLPSCAGISGGKCLIHPKVP
jgi:hypothetical protein